MTTANKTSFPVEVAVHIDIKYNMKSNLLVSWEDLTIPHLFHHVSAFIKDNPHIHHILLNCELPKVSLCGLINIQGFFDHLGNSDSKLVGFMPISRLDFGNDIILPTQYNINPPI